jgi:hypothetical protein
MKAKFPAPSIRAHDDAEPPGRRKPPPQRDYTAQLRAKIVEAKREERAYFKHLAQTATDPKTKAHFERKAKG